MIRKIGLYLNTDKHKSITLAPKCLAYLQEKGVTTAILDEQSDYVKSLPGETARYNYEEFFSIPEAILVLGGDGTLLTVARHACFHSIAIIGINLGKLGFLTEGEATNWKDILSALCDGTYHYDRRSMLNCRHKGSAGIEHHHIALNDIFIRNSDLRMMRVKIGIDGEELDNMRADGIIVATPTGSTAYSLSAGGPVVAPNADVQIVNPVCPHRLHDKAYIVPASSKLQLTFPEKDKHNAMLSVDGQKYIPIQKSDTIYIEKSKFKTTFIRLKESFFYEKLRKKMITEIQ